MTVAEQMQVTALCLILGVIGCATPQHRAATHAWQVICGYAPHRGGPMAIDEMRAMDTVQGWKLSVAEVDAQCLKR